MRSGRVTRVECIEFDVTGPGVAKRAHRVRSEARARAPRVTQAYYAPALVTDPYRDDRASLAAENERLRTELARVRSVRVTRLRWTAATVALVALDVGAFAFIREGINSASDLRSGLGMALAAALVALHVIIALRVTRRGN